MSMPCVGRRARCGSDHGIDLSRVRIEEHGADRYGKSTALQRFVQTRVSHDAAFARLLLAACAVLLGQFAYAANDTDEMPASAQPPTSLSRVVVLGARVPLTAGQETEGLTVLTREKIERMGVASGADLLRQVAGVQVDQLGGPGGLSLAYIRGSDPNHVLVLIDGVRVIDPTNSRGGGFDLSSISPNEIERIEVLRGAASSTYGADALGGVINILTRRDETGASSSAGAGGLGYRALSARASLAGEDGSRLSLSASTLKDGLESEGSRLRLDQLSLAGRILVSKDSRVEMQLRHADRTSSTFPDDSGGVELAEIRSLERGRSEGTSLGLRYLVDAGAWSLTLEGTGFRHLQITDSPGVAPGVRSDFGLPASSSRTLYRRTGVLLNAVRHMAGGTELALGGEFQREQGTAVTTYELFGMQIPADFDLRRNTRSAFAEIKWVASPKLTVRAGVRHDAVDGNGAQTSPTVGVRYGLSEANDDADGHLMASYSEGFRPPSFFALGLPPALGGNPTLNAEHSRGFSVGYGKSLPRGVGELSMAVFRRNYTDLVTFDNEANQLVNAERVYVKGFEFAIQLQASETFNLQAQYTRLISRVSPADEPLRQRPGHRAGVQTAWQVTARSRLVWRLEFADQIFDSSIPTGNRFLPSYLRNDLVLTHTVTPAFTISAAIDNLANRNNLWYVGARSQGRRARVGASTSF